MMPSPMVWSTPPSQNGSSRNTTRLSAQPASISFAPRWRNFAATPRLIGAPAWRRGANDRGRQKPTRNRKSGAPTAMVA